MNSSCPCVLACENRDEPVSAGLAEEAPAAEQETFTPGPFGRWALFLAGTRRAREEWPEAEERAAGESPLSFDEGI